MANSGNRAAGVIALDRSGHVTRDKIFVHEGPNGFICVGLGPGARLLALAERADDLPALRRLDLALAEFYDPYLQRLAALAKGYNPDQPRVPAGNPDGGEWTSDGGAETDDANVVPAAAQMTGHSPAEKKRFVEAHLTDAQKAADQLGVPVENILGLSALESSWGDHRFAAQGNNYLGIHYPAPFANGHMFTLDGKTKVSTFASYADCLRSFIAESGTLVRGITNPEEFAAILQNSKKYGINRDGSKDPTYVSKVAKTIRGLSSIIARRRI